MVLLRTLLAALVCSIWARAGVASGGELSLEVMSTHDVAILRHPGLVYHPTRTSAVYIPRFGVKTDYALSRRWHVGFETVGSLPRSTFSDGVRYQDVQLANLSTRYHDVMLPVFAEYVFETGSDWAWLVHAGTGVRWAHWQDLALLAPDKEARQLPFNPIDIWSAAWFGQLRAGAQWRPIDHIVMQAAASFAMAQQGDIYAGLWLSGGWIVGAGPSL